MKNEISNSVVPALVLIGKIETPYVLLEECPNNIQPDGPSCRIVLHEQYCDGLSGLEVGQSVLVLYWLGDSQWGSHRLGEHKNHYTDCVSQLGLGNEVKGVFALRSPYRPNPIGAAVVAITAIEKDSITVNGLDCLNGTALLDIKPAIYHEVTSVIEH